MLKNFLHLIFLNMLLVLNVWGESAGSCVEFGNIDKPWHFIQLPEGISTIQWDAASEGVSSISFNVSDDKFSEWLNKCSIKLDHDASMREWSVSDSKDVRSISVIQSVKSHRVCIEVRDNPMPEISKNPKGYSGCVSLLTVYDKRKLVSE